MAQYSTLNFAQTPYKMEKEINMPFQILEGFEKIAAYQGITKEELARLINLSKKARELKSRIPLDKIESIYTYLLEKSNDELLTLGTKPLAKGSLLFACKLGCRSKNLFNALSLIEEFYRLTLGPFNIKLIRKAGKVKLCIELQLKPEIDHVLFNDIYLMMFYRFVCMLIGKRLEVHRFFILHSKHAYSGEYNLILNENVELNSQYLGFEFDECHLQDPIKAKFEDISQYFINPLKLCKLHLADNITYAGKVQQLFISMVTKHGLPTKHDVANALNISPRTLHRKLLQDSTSFQELKDEYRYKLALHYLINSTLTLEEITFKLKLSDTSSFIHRFKKWSGINPDAYRKKNKI